MSEIIKDPKIQQLSQSLGPALLENPPLLEDMIKYYEKRVWNKINAPSRIDSYLKELIDFRKEPMFNETKFIFAALIQRMKETLEYYDNNEPDKINQYKKLAVKIWDHYKRDKCKKYDERLTEKKVIVIIKKAENINEKYFITRYKGSKY